MTNPAGLLWFAISQHMFLVAVALIALAVAVAFAVFGGGWS